MRVFSEKNFKQNIFSIQEMKNEGRFEILKFNLHKGKNKTSKKSK